ncbi:hypothetical protein EVAR_93508_1 [Eumeta japonica]|uniref:Uncharacterized protein n=1 Tax=Eumeta variegata TaxID=151549 RepID=A0A4C1TMG7_EUMVA|nr:hypothetical protein EVAR_93508_1 [Eumeta japonica]
MSRRRRGESRASRALRQRFTEINIDRSRPSAGEKTGDISAGRRHYDCIASYLRSSHEIVATRPVRDARRRSELNLRRSEIGIPVKVGFYRERAWARAVRHYLAAFAALEFPTFPVVSRVVFNCPYAQPQTIAVGVSLKEMGLSTVNRVPGHGPRARPTNASFGATFSIIV